MFTYLLCCFRVLLHAVQYFFRHSRNVIPLINMTFVLSEDSEREISLAEFVYLVFTRMAGESYRRQLDQLCVTVIV